MKVIFLTFISTFLYAQVQYNHPELDWKTFETEHFRIHYYSQTEISARKGAYVAEEVYESITKLYNYEPFDKTDIVFTDTDDISNGAAYFFDNKIIIWTSPLDFELRGSHRWLQNVITHEFAHIVSIQSAQKFGKSIPGGYVQWIGYEKEKRSDVLYGYPNTLISYPIPGTTIPPWFAEGLAQYMYPDADWDNWDTIRDMILRDQILNGNSLSWHEINTFGKRGIGNESVYNTGYAFTRYLAVKYGHSSFQKILSSLSKPFNYSISKSIKDATAKDGKAIFIDFNKTLEKRYNTLTSDIIENDQNSKIIQNKGTANLFPMWNEDGDKIAYISNQNHDFFSSTDLYIYDLISEKNSKIIDGVISLPAWNGENIIYYSKRAKLPNKVGSKFFDLYEYDLNTKKEKKITNDARAYSPAFSKQDSAIFYLATFDGTQNIYKINLKSKTSEKVSSYDNHEILNNLKYDRFNNRLLFDVTTNHFKNIHYINLEDSTSGKFIHNNLWDSRNATPFKDGVVYSEDRTGIFNLFYIDKARQGYITNLTGGAFMPDYHQSGKIVYSQFQNGQYNIAILDSIKLFKTSMVGYSDRYYEKNKSLTDPLRGVRSDSSDHYVDHFPPMFFMPRLTMDYEKIKLGTYFYSSEIIDKVNLIGGVSLNKLFDQDLFFIMEYRHLYPTLFFETYYMTRNTEERTNYSAYNLDNNIKFRLLEFKGGLRAPFYGSHIEVFANWAQYRASIKENVREKPELKTGYGYDYFKGKQFGINWNFQQYKRSVDQSINPVGYKLQIEIVNELNQFIDGLDLSDSGTLTSIYNNHNLTRTKIETGFSFNIPYTNKWSAYFGGKFGSISNSDADSFFHFFGGGSPGLKGYPYYSLQGTDLMIGEIGLRIPVFKEKNYIIGPLSINNMTMGFENQFGDAWNRTNTYDQKGSIGVQLRISGYSFYNYPTAIGIEYHQPQNQFYMDIGDGKNILYGDEDRIYLNILFGF